ncbi:Gfo/Idh/MocA family oxidoreductase [Vibrio sp. SCSIO 43132]|uniref:Gfo/Idh/MocA family protein n=1 Tax=Vibrio sp. SCSIO 43132 TaxID=2779363 RepID=UPI001CA911C9|nr:Gfo/Idh/MocA family oxidoreductase [Vibrio sp. SCSIO 43132]UAB70546.1 Gfo/Idh/MocA family oxidoreductase [Vibrio sp. SCSIO 43132]
MDYLSANRYFKIKKVIRYLRIYGLKRTIIKILGQLYYAKRDNGWFYKVASLVFKRSKNSRRNKIGLIGLGNFCFTTISYYLARNFGNTIGPVYDVDSDRSDIFINVYKGSVKAHSIDDVINNKDVDLVFIASNHASHAPYAVDCLNRGKSVHIEKPLAVNFEQAELLFNAIELNPNSKIFTGFNRPNSSLFFTLQDELHKQSGSVMINWFIAGHEIEDGHWYFEEKEGGRVLGNLCHWLDLSLEIVGLGNALPCRISSASNPNDNSNFIVNLNFGDGSSASLTFSAKGHTFEGVREKLNVHKGDCLAYINDFEELGIDVIDKKRRITLGKRDHGHEFNILNSANMDTPVSLDYIRTTTLLSLCAKQAVENGTQIILEKDFSVKEIK